MTRLRYGVIPHVVFVPRTANRSLSPHGIPCNGPRYVPAAISSSARRAWRCAKSSVRLTTHRSLGSYCFRRDRYSFVRSVGLICRVSISLAR